MWTFALPTVASTLWWAVGKVLDLDAGAAAQDGGSHRWLSGGLHVSGGGALICRAGNERGSSWWLRRVLYWTSPRSVSRVWAGSVCHRALVT